MNFFINGVYPAKFIAAYIMYFNLLKLSKKFEDKIIKAIEDEALVSMHPS